MYIEENNSIIEIARMFSLKNENVRKILKDNNINLDLRKRNSFKIKRDDRGRFIKKWVKLIIDQQENN